MSVSVTEEIQSLSPSAIIELFELDTSGIQGGGINRFHAGLNGLSSPIIWCGFTYFPMPIEASGFDVTSQGSLPRPKIKVANVQGLFSALAASGDDLIGCKLTRKRTFARYLDAVNFPGGNPEANPNQSLPSDLYFIDRKSSENRYVVEWELASAFDLEGVRLPFRQVVQNSCQWKYRSAECGWTGGRYTKMDEPTSDSAQDFCSKRLSSCRVRFGEYSVLPFGGFPGAQRNG